MEKIFEQYKDLHVAAVKVYAVSGKAAKIVAPTADTDYYTKEELADAFVKGCVILPVSSGSITGVISKPVVGNYAGSNNAYYALTYPTVTAGEDSDPDVLTPNVVYSGEYSAE